MPFNETRDQPRKTDRSALAAHRKHEGVRTSEPLAALRRRQIDGMLRAGTPRETVLRAAAYPASRGPRNEPFSRTADPRQRVEPRASQRAEFSRRPPESLEVVEKSSTPQEQQRRLQLKSSNTNKPAEALQADPSVAGTKYAPVFPLSASSNNAAGVPRQFRAMHLSKRRCTVFNERIHKCDQRGARRETTNEPAAARGSFCSTAAREKKAPANSTYATDPQLHTFLMSGVSVHMSAQRVPTCGTFDVQSNN